MSVFICDDIPVSNIMMQVDLVEGYKRTGHRTMSNPATPSADNPAAVATAAKPFDA